MGEVASAARRRGLSLKLLRPFPANIKSCSETYRVVTPSQAFSWEISRLIVAVAIFKDRATTTLTTARNDDERMDSHGKKWIFERNQKAALLNLCAATFPSDEARSP